jgi:hypothetical protein
LFSSGSNLTTGDVGLSTDLVLSATNILYNQKTPSAGAGAGLIQTISYGESANAAASVGLRFQRRRGNNNSRLSLQPNDYVGNIEWRPGRGGSNYGTTAKFGAKVDGGYTATTSPVPIGMEMTVVNSSGTQLSHSFYANGNVNFSNTVNATNFTGNGAGLTNLLPTQISNGNSSVSFTGAGGDLLIQTDNTQFASFGNGRKLQLNGVEADSANGSQLILNNGGMQLIQEDLGGGFASFDFKSYFSTGFIAPYTFYRARGNAASPNNVQSGDAIKTETYIVYGDSGNTFVNVGGYRAIVTANDNAGNVQSKIQIATNSNDNGSIVELYGDIVTLEGNSVIELNANNSNVSGNLNVAGNINYTKTFGSFTSNATQTNSNVGNAVYMTLNNDEGSNGVSIVSSSQITIARTGRYNLQFSAQLEKTDSGTDEVEIWLVKNGTPVANSATRLAQQGNNEKGVAAWNWLDNATTANTYYQIAWASTDANMQITAIPSANTLSGVAVPSLIVTVVPVGA